MHFLAKQTFFGEVIFALPLPQWYLYSSPPLFAGHMFQDPWQMPETVANTRSYMYYDFSKMIGKIYHTYDNKSGSEINNKNKIEQL